MPSGGCLNFGALKSLILAWWLWALGAAFFIGCTMLLATCATTLPFCEKPIGHAAQTSYGTITVFDVENTDKLIAMITGLAAGTCRLDKGGT